MLDRFGVRPLAALLGAAALAAAGCGNGGGNPCDGVTCNNPPAPQCDGDILMTFADTGVCEDGECVYPEEPVACDDAPAPSCDGAEIVHYAAGGYCEDGACHYEEAEREMCDDPPASYCDGDDEVYFASTGTCQEGECHYEEAGRIVCEDIAHVCDEAEGACVDPCADVSCPPQETWCEEDVLWMLAGHCDWQTGECVYEEVATDLPGCGFGYNFDFEIWSNGYPEGFVMHPHDRFSVTEESAVVNTGQRSAFLETEVNEGRYLRSSLPFEFVEEGAVYTFHFWYRFERRTGGASAFLQPIIEVADADGNVDPEWTIEGPRITEETDEWREVTVTTPPMSADRAFLWPVLHMRGAGARAYVDDWAVTLPIDRHLNSRRDLDSLLFLFNGDYWVASGLDNRGMIYPTARIADVDNGWDQLLFTWVGSPSDTLVPAPLSKDGMVAGPSPGGVLFVLFQEVDGSCGWQRYDHGGEGWVTVSTHTTCSSEVMNYALEGELNLVEHLEGVHGPSDIPTWFHFAASHWTTGAGGTLVPHTQAPASRDEDGNVDRNETYRAHRAGFVSGRVSYYFH